MSWLRNHFRHFVLPGIRTLARAKEGPIFDHDIRPSDKQVRPSTKCKYVEAGMLYAIISSMLSKRDPIRDAALELCRRVGQPGDTELVYELDLGGRGLDNRVKKLGEGYQGIEGADVLHSFIMNSIKALKRKTKKRATVIYPGRDVWCWEVISRKLGMPSVYDARVSRRIADEGVLIKDIIAEWGIEDWRRTVLFDSGYAGTVPRAIGRAAGLDKMCILMLSALKSEEQIFPSHAKARRKALACEYLAKYRKRATIEDGKVYQEIASLDEFIKAALLTIWLWYHVSPAHLPSWGEQPPPRPRKPDNDIPTLNLTWQNTGNNLFASGSSQITSPATGNTGAGIITFPMVTSSTSAATTTSTPMLDQLWGQGAASTLSGNYTPVLDPNTLMLLDPNTLQPLPGQPNPPLPSQHPPQGHGLGQYPGPPIQGLASQATPLVKKAKRGKRKKPRKKDRTTPFDQYMQQHGLINNSPSQSSQSSGGPGGGATSTPTASGPGKHRIVSIPSVGPLPVATDGIGRPITG